MTTVDPRIAVVGEVADAATTVVAKVVEVAPVPVPAAVIAAAVKGIDARSEARRAVVVTGENPVPTRREVPKKRRPRKTNQ